MRAGTSRPADLEGALASERRFARLASVAGLAACAPLGPPTNAEAPAPPNVISFDARPTYIALDFSEERRQPTQAAVRYTQDERPDACKDIEQPAVVGIAVDAGGARSTVWACFEGCGPGLEYVTEERRGRHHHGFALRCVPVCAPEEHRGSYVLAGLTCAPGPPNFTTAAALAREAAAQVSAYILEETRDMDEVEQRVDVLRKAPAPMDYATATTWASADLTLRLLEVGDREHAVDGRFGRETRGVIKGAMAGTAFARAEALRLVALRRRLDRGKQAAGEAERRHSAEDYAIRSSVVATAKRREIARSCAESCANALERCRSRCQEMTAAVCAACAVEDKTCTSKCR